MSSTSSYWCYSCSRHFRILALDNGTNEAVACPYCDEGFIEEIESSDIHNRRFPAMNMISSNDNNRQNSNRRISVDRFNINPIIVLRGITDDENNSSNGNNDSGFDFFYDEESGSGLTPVSTSISESLMGLGLDRLLEQLSQIEKLDWGNTRTLPLQNQRSNQCRRFK